MFGVKDRDNNLVQNGLLELHLGKKGVTMNVGMGGADMSLGTIAQSLAGLEAWKVNLEILTSGQEEGWKYASALRTLYSVGGAAEKALYEEVLSGKTNIAERRDGEYSAKTETNGDGTKTIYIGREALEKGSRFGLNVLLAHEAYRNGIDDGEVGQREETDRAVLGHIGAAYALGQTYGIGAIGEALGKEVATYLAALSTGNMDDLARLLASYDASGDYWRLMANGDLVDDGDGWLKDENGNYINADGSRTATRRGNTIGAQGKETGLLRILYGNNKAYKDFSDDEIKSVQKIMYEAGLQTINKIQENEFRKAQWGSGSTGKVIKADTILRQYGNTVIAPVFMNALDKISNLVVFNTTVMDEQAVQEVPTLAKERFARYVEAKRAFYFGEHKIFNQSDLPLLTWAQDFKPSTLKVKGVSPYIDGMHKGIDICGPAGTDIYSYYGGKVIRNDSTNSAGNTVVIEYGFDFEGYFYSTGVQAQFMHLQKPSSLPIGAVISGTTKIGAMGDTGVGTGTHLHYQLMADIQGSNPKKPSWTMYAERRDTFIGALGLIPSNQWVADISKITVSNPNNYYADAYKRYFYNTNGLKTLWGVKYGNN